MDGGRSFRRFVYFHLFEQTSRIDLPQFWLKMASNPTANCMVVHSSYIDIARVLIAHRRQGGMLSVAREQLSYLALHYMLLDLVMYDRLISTALRWRGYLLGCDRRLPVSIIAIKIDINLYTLLQYPIKINIDVLTTSPQQGPRATFSVHSSRPIA